MSANLSSKIKVLVLCSSAILVSIYLGFVFFTEKKDEARRAAPVEILSFKGLLPKDAALTATIDMGGKISSVPVSENTLQLTDEQQVNFLLPYILKATYRKNDGSYRDLSWRIDELGIKYFILADGFSPDNKISLIMNGQKVYTVPFDWSGRIELPIFLVIENDNNICVEIEEAQEKSSLCHTITGKRAS